MFDVENSERCGLRGRRGLEWLPLATNLCMLSCILRARMSGQGCSLEAWDSMGTIISLERAPSMSMEVVLQSP